MARPKDNNTSIAKPFVKWAGGKGQLLTQLDALLPIGLDEREFTYIEPFVGGVTPIG
ncbi:MAG: DNA adenine methylase [Prevotella sp.]|nr:DNA adenine methylase [Prevotella sp.]